MAVSVETAKREMSGAMIDTFRLKATPFLAKVERCATMQELRYTVFDIINNLRGDEPEKAKMLMSAWAALDEA